MKRETVLSAGLFGIFVASGCSALIYEIAWFQQLSLVLGASAVSLAILLTSFMGGMCLGSLGFSRWVSARHHPLRVYATLELLLAVCGVGTLWLLPVIGNVYCHLTLTGQNDLFARSLVAIILLLPPTMLMGATLPAVSRWVESNRTGMAWLGWFYAANTFGAVIGSLLAGMYLLRTYDVYVATYVAVAINLGASVAAWTLSRVVPVASRSPSFDERGPAPMASEDVGVIQIVIGMSGLTALGAEVIWTRHLGLLLGPTVYTFSMILAVFLSGLGIGSSVGAVIGRRVRSPKLALAMTQLLLLAAIPYAAYLIVHVVPYWLSRRSPGELFTVRVAHDFTRTLVTLFPATCLWGASFPLAVAAATGRGRDPGRVVGGLYAANTLGAILGSLGVSLFAIPYGGQFVQRGLSLLGGLSGMLLLAAMLWKAARSATRQDRQTNFGLAPGLNADQIHGDSPSGLEFFPRIINPSIIGLGLLMVAAIGCVVAWNCVVATPNALLADGRYINQSDRLSYYLYVAEGLDSPIVVSELDDGTRCFHVAGKVEASTLEQDVRTQRLLGHLPAMAHPSPTKVLVVGCGSGMTAGAFLLHPTVEEIVLCEMENCVIEASRDNFADYNYGVLRDPRTRIVHDDARHFLATTRETFDVITTDPIHPWVKGAATLYTAEFFQLCRSHLKSRGNMTLWVPLYESNEATVKCELATFLQVFPHASIWSGESAQVGYDLVVVGSVDDRPMDVQQIVDKLLTNESLQISFEEVGLGSTESLRRRFAGHGPELHTWLIGAEINRDRNLRLQYLAGSSADQYLEQSIFQAMSAKRDEPSE